MCHVKLSRGKALEKFVAQWSATNVFSGKVCKKAGSYCAVGRPTSLQTFSPPYIIMLPNSFPQECHTIICTMYVSEGNTFSIHASGSKISLKLVKINSREVHWHFSLSLEIIILRDTHERDVHTPYTCSNEFAAAWMNLGIVQAALNKTQVS